MVLYGSNFGDANKHTTTNLPVILAGGGFKHGQHLAFDRERNYPLPNLFVSMLQRMGVEADRFATSTGTMRGWRWRERRARPGAGDSRQGYRAAARYFWGTRVPHSGQCLLSSGMPRRS